MLSKTKKSSFCAMLSRMKYIPRWSLMRCARTENLAEHTAKTAQLPMCCAVPTMRCSAAAPARIR